MDSDYLWIVLGLVSNTERPSCNYFLKSLTAKTNLLSTSNTYLLQKCLRNNWLRHFLFYFGFYGDTATNNFTNACVSTYKMSYNSLETSFDHFSSKDATCTIVTVAISSSLFCGRYSHEFFCITELVLAFFTVLITFSSRCYQAQMRRPTLSLAVPWCKVLFRYWHRSKLVRAIRRRKKSWRDIWSTLPPPPSLLSRDRC